MEENKVKEKLDNLRNSTIDEITYYDVKDEWKSKLEKLNDIENKIFELKEEYDSFNSYKKMLLYKRTANNLGIDCDVSLRSTMIYVLAFDYVLENKRKLQKQPYSGCKYCLTNKNDFDYRGDTMNSFKQITDCYLNFFKNDIEHKSENFENVRKFVELNHTVGNFIPVPFKTLEKRRFLSLNIKRNGTVGDYWDLTLYYIYIWYITEDKKYLTKLVGKSDNFQNMIKEWLKIFGTGMDGWKEFTNKNYLYNSFVDENYKPIYFWKGHFDGEVKPTEVKHCLEFFEKVPSMIEKRGKTIAEVILNKLKKENLTNDEILKNIL